MNISSSPRPLKKPEWAVLVYTSSSADIEQATTDGLAEMSRQLTGARDVSVAVQRGLKGTAERFEVETDIGELKSCGNIGTTDMASPTSLADFLKWGMSKYPAEHYAVVVGGHGAGFLGCVTNTEKQKMMRLPDVHKAFSEAPVKPEVVAFNTCLMSCGEMATELRDIAPALVASQAGEEGMGMPLGGWISSLYKCQDGASAARLMVDECRDTADRTSHVSALDPSKVPAYLGGMSELANEILENRQARPALQEDLKSVGGLWQNAWDFALHRQVDVGNLCETWSTDERLPQSLRDAATRAGHRAGSVVVDKSGSGVHTGLSVFIPENKPWEPMKLFDKTLGEIYGDLAHSKATAWDKAIHWLSEAK